MQVARKQYVKYKHKNIIKHFFTNIKKKKEKEITTIIKIIKQKKACGGWDKRPIFITIK